jgi:two-component system, chemotaxis family, CheB/CheR fusion protein
MPGERPSDAGPNFSNAVIRYGGAVVAVLLAAAVRWASQPAMGPAPPYITFYLAVVAAAAFGGLRPGLLATLLGGLLGVGLATWPAEKLHLASLAEQLRLAIYLLSGCGISLIADAMHRARRHAREEAARLGAMADELRQANERLVESDQGKDRFLAVLAHELRNPLMPIKHSLYLLEHLPADADVARHARAIIGRQVDQMARLVNDLLDVTRIHHDKLDLQRAAIDLREVVTKTLEDHRAVFLERGIGLHEHRPPQPMWIYGDASRLGQVLGNLLHNALKFTNRGNDVDVELEQQADHAVLRVRDTGMGIAPEFLPRIFELFSQAERSRERTAGGLGLGLTLVRSLVELHGGTVAAHSEGPGRGAQFTLTLPLDTMPVVPAPLPAAPQHHTHSRRRVLLVEDDVDSAEVLCEMLRAEGHEVVVCHSGAEAIEKAASIKPEAVLCDIGLPDIDGYEVARRLRSQRQADRPALIALTGYATREAQQKAIDAGFDRHVIKPSSPEELEEALSSSRGS